MVILRQASLEISKFSCKFAAAKKGPVAQLDRATAF